jgi:hypothetical protein
MPRHPGILPGKDMKILVLSQPQKKDRDMAVRGLPFDGVQKLQHSPPNSSETITFEEGFINQS